MYTDPRGGHNQKKFNEDFFKTWSPSMAYILGFISADGAVIDARKSSRTCYTCIQITDKDLLQDIGAAMSSFHNIYVYPQRYTNFKNKIYLCKEIYRLRFGSKKMFQDLVNLGITPRKSLRLKIPNVPRNLFHFFIRGYFDGDGCVSINRSLNTNNFSVQVIFTSGNNIFLDSLSNKFRQELDINIHKQAHSNGAFQLRYKKKDGLKILNYIYQDLKRAPFLKRKYKIYLQAINNL